MYHSKFTDLTSYTKVLQGKLLEGNKVSISPLGPAEGLFIRQVPEEVSDQFLELYFESPRSCGEEECVGEVRSCICCQDRMVVVVIKDTEGEDRFEIDYFYNFTFYAFMFVGPFNMLFSAKGR